MGDGRLRRPSPIPHHERTSHSDRREESAISTTRKETAINRWMKRNNHLSRLRLNFGKTSIASALRTQLYWSQYKMLISSEDRSKKEYYELETVKNNWTGRELERQISFGNDSDSLTSSVAITKLSWRASTSSTSPPKVNCSMS